MTCTDISCSCIPVTKAQTRCLHSRKLSHSHLPERALCSQSLLQLAKESEIDRRDAQVYSAQSEALAWLRRPVCDSKVFTCHGEQNWGDRIGSGSFGISRAASSQTKHFNTADACWPHRMEADEQWLPSQCCQNCLFRVSLTSPWLQRTPCRVPHPPAALPARATAPSGALHMQTSSTSEGRIQLASFTPTPGFPQRRQRVAGLHDS